MLTQVWYCEAEPWGRMVLQGRFEFSEVAVKEDREEVLGLF